MSTYVTASGTKRTQRGYSLVEVIVATGLLCLVILGTVTLFSSTCRLWRVGTSGTSANMYGSLAMRKLVTEVQEGRIAYAVGDHLFVQFPYYDSSSGTYQRNVNGPLVEYYLSGETGTEAPSADGENVLWKKVGTDQTRMIAHLHRFEFDLQSSTLVQLKIWGLQSENASINPDLVQQRVSLRNR